MITIDDFLERNKDCIKHGFVSYDTVWGWQYYEEKPTFVRKKYWMENRDSFSVTFYVFDIAPFEGNPEDSLREVGL